jgi:hypothetical protein
MLEINKVHLMNSIDGMAKVVIEDVDNVKKTDITNFFE